MEARAYPRVRTPHWFIIPGQRVKNGEERLVGITTHYSQSELASLIVAAEKVCGTDSHRIPAIVWLKRKSG